MPSTAQIARLMALRQPSLYVGADVNFRSGDGALILDVTVSQPEYIATFTPAVAPNSGDTVIVTVWGNQSNEDVTGATPIVSLSDNKGNAYSLVKNILAADDVGGLRFAYMFKASGIHSGAGFQLSATIDPNHINGTTNTCAMQCTALMAGSTFAELDSTAAVEQANGHIDIALPNKTNKFVFMFVSVYTVLAQFSDYTVNAPYGKSSKGVGNTQVGAFVYAKNPLVDPAIVATGGGGGNAYFIELAVSL